MRRLPLFLGLLVVGCGGAEYDAADADAEGMVAAIALADVAGTWNLTGTLATEEPTIVNYSVIATDSESGWVINLPGRDPVDLRIVAVDGDSIVAEAGPFESILRDGVMVTTRTVIRLQDGMLVGVLMASYDTDPAETVPGTFEGTRAME
jgi:hypothetical protein